jgi:hypothetical protein
MENFNKILISTALALTLAVHLELQIFLLILAKPPNGTNRIIMGPEENDHKKS